MLPGTTHSIVVAATCTELLGTLINNCSEVGDCSPWAEGRSAIYFRKCPVTDRMMVKEAYQPA